MTQAEPGSRLIKLKQSLAAAARALYQHAVIKWVDHGIANG